MTAREILHIAPRDKFMAGFINLLRRHDDISRHQFFIYGGGAYEVPSGDNIRLAADTKAFYASIVFLFVKMARARKIILHGLFDIKMVILLLLQPWLLPKCYWIIWGGDLYVRRNGARKWKWAIKERLRRAVICRLGHLVTYVSGDIELARKWYGATGAYHECLMYPSNVFFDEELASVEKKTINIQVGNSADPTNNHIEVFEKLGRFKGEDIRIFAPLSYGNMEYAQAVTAVGKEIFGEKFTPMTRFLARDEYLRFLASVDVAIFNHRRQQAMGNTISLLGFGKTVYMRAGLSSTKTLMMLGLTIKDVEFLDLSLLSPVEKDDNRKIIIREFSESKLIGQLNGILA